MNAVSPHQIYTACKQFGLVVSWRAEVNNDMVIILEQTDRIHKNKHTIRIGAVSLALKRTSSGNFSKLPLTFPELVPDHQSPENIVNALNDDCLREIFRKLNRDDQCAVANVCRRFRDVASTLIPKHIEIANEHCTPLWRLEDFIRTFGSTFRTAHITTVQCADIILVFLSEYCDNLEELKGEVHFQNTMNDMAALFPRLRRLDLQHCGIADIVFQPNAHIEAISVETVDNVPPISFPKLRDLRLWIDASSTDSSLRQFFAFNEQIEILVLDFVWEDFISGVLNNLLQLQELEVSHLSLTHNDASAFGRFKRLHTLRLHNVSSAYTVVNMLRTLWENGVKLKTLTLGKKLLSDGIDYIIQMRSLEYLSLSSIDDDQLGQLADNCIRLKEMHISKADITPIAIYDAVRHAINLEKATFWIHLDRISSLRIVDQSDVIDAIAEWQTKKLINVQIAFTGVVDSHRTHEVSFQMSQQWRLFDRINVSPFFLFVFYVLFVFITDFEGDFTSSQRLDNTRCQS